MRLKANFALLAAVLLIVESVVELGRVVFDRPWLGTYPIGLHSDVISIFLALLWTSGAVLLVLKDRRPTLERPAWMVAVAGNIALLLHAIVARMYGTPAAFVNALVALLLAVLLTQAFRGESRRAYHFSETTRHGA
jgi:hypothetical protein